jgi:hypothetical protein
MKIQVAIILLEVVLIILALAVYLIATIVQLFKINAGLDVTLASVGEIVAKTAPVNGVLDAINGTLVTARDALEGLHLKKAGPDAAGLVESLFPGEGANFLRRVGKPGKVVNVGTVYTRGVGILASLGRGAPIGAAHTKGPAVRDPQYSTTAASMLYPRPGGARSRPKSPVVGREAAHSPYEAALTPGERPRDPTGRPVEARPQGTSSGQTSVEKQPDAAPPAAPAPSRITSAKGSRPWEQAPPQRPDTGSGGDAAPPAQPEADAPPAPPTSGRITTAKGTRPWER